MRKTITLTICMLCLLPVLANGERSEIPLHKVQALNQTIAASGDPVDIYFPQTGKQLRAIRQDYFPVIVVLQGALVDKDYYSILGQNIASYGFVVLIPNHTSSILGTGFTELAVIRQALAHARQEDTDATSPLRGITDTARLGVAGHSFGGAALAFGINNICTFPFCDPEPGFVMPSEFRAAALLAGNSGQFAIDSTGIPTLVMYGSFDSGIEIGRNFYEQLIPPRAFIEIAAATHFGMNDISSPPGADTDRDEPEQQLPQAISAARFGRWTGLFFRAHIKQDWRAWHQIYRDRVGEAGVTITSDAYAIGDRRQSGWASRSDKR